MLQSVEVYEKSNKILGMELAVVRGDFLEVQMTNSLFQPVSISAERDNNQRWSRNSRKLVFHDTLDWFAVLWTTLQWLTRLIGLWN